jgi:hypothetical protein
MNSSIKPIASLFEVQKRLWRPNPKRYLQVQWLLVALDFPDHDRMTDVPAGEVIKKHGAVNPCLCLRAVP